MIQTKSSFFYIDPVDSTNIYLDFDEGGPEISAMVEIGKYTPTDLATAVSNAMTNVGTQDYNVTFDRDLRRFVISASSPFTLLISTGTHVGSDVFPILGFTGSDLGPLTTFTGNLQAGSEFKPQFKLQEYVPPENNQKAISASINKTASGDVEVVKFGVEKFFEFNIPFITNISQAGGTFLEDNPTGVEDALSFLQFCVEKRNLEFMPDRDDKDTFYKILLESTADERDGTGYRLYEFYDKGLPGYFETKKLVFRLRE